jgi:hypothetical protein
MDRADYKVVSEVESMDESRSDSGLRSRSESESGSGSESDSDMDQEWKRVGEELERLSHLHSSILQRMENLTTRTTAMDLKYDIQECHEASLKDLDQKGEITFGQRLLRLFDCSPKTSTDPSKKIEIE